MTIKCGALFMHVTIIAEDSQWSNLLHAWCIKRDQYHWMSSMPVLKHYFSLVILLPPCIWFQSTMHFRSAQCYKNKNRMFLQNVTKELQRKETNEQTHLLYFEKTVKAEIQCIILCFYLGKFSPWQRPITIAIVHLGSPAPTKPSTKYHQEVQWGVIFFILFSSYSNYFTHHCSTTFSHLQCNVHHLLWCHIPCW